MDLMQLENIEGDGNGERWVHSLSETKVLLAVIMINRAASNRIKDNVIKSDKKIAVTSSGNEDIRLVTDGDI
jgi:transcriptional regulator